jgi:hypothetical protein
MAMSRTLARVAGALLGVGLAVFLLTAARPTRSFSSLPARASFAVAVTGELSVRPQAPRPLLAATALAPGAAPARGSAVVRNQTGGTLAVGFRAQAAVHDLDGLLRVRVSAEGKVLADTTLQGLRDGTVTALDLPSGAEGHVAVETWIPAAITDGYQGLNVAVTLVPTVRAED